MVLEKSSQMSNFPTAGSRETDYKGACTPIVQIVNVKNRSIRTLTVERRKEREALGNIEVSLNAVNLLFNRRDDLVFNLCTSLKPEEQRHGEQFMLLICYLNTLGRFEKRSGDISVKTKNVRLISTTVKIDYRGRFYLLMPCSPHSTTFGRCLYTSGGYDIDALDPNGTEGVIYQAYLRNLAQPQIKKSSILQRSQGSFSLEGHTDPSKVILAELAKAERLSKKGTLPCEFDGSSSGCQMISWTRGSHALGRACNTFSKDSYDLLTYQNQDLYAKIRSDTFENLKVEQKPEG